MIFPPRLLIPPTSITNPRGCWNTPPTLITTTMSSMSTMPTTSISIKRDRPQSATQSPRSTSTSTPSSSSSSLPLPLPRFLTHPLPALHQKFRSVNAHEALFRRTAAPAATPLHQSTAHARDRYADILPWAHNAVRLRALDDPYINASPVALGRAGESFIATQGPLADEEPHFWEMVWQERCEVVVMLTQAWEDEREKCSVYYPEAEGEVKGLEGWGRVRCVRVREEARMEVRELRVWKGEGEGGEEEGEGRTVWHFLFLGWPDHDIPLSEGDQNALLELMRLSRSCVQERGKDEEVEGEAKAETEKEKGDITTPPRIVHCSAGVGRTGTFIALDHLLHEFEDGKLDCFAAEDDDCAYEDDDEDEEGDTTHSNTEDEDPIFDTVKSLREQRMWLVGKPKQYAFIYQILRERWEARETGQEPRPVNGLSNGQVSQAKKRRLDQEGSGYELDSDGKASPPLN